MIFLLILTLLAPGFFSPWKTLILMDRNMGEWHYLTGRCLGGMHVNKLPFVDKVTDIFLTTLDSNLP